MHYQIHRRAFQMGRDATITDEQAQPVLQIKGKFLTLNDQLKVYAPDGEQVAEITGKIFSLRPTYTVLIHGYEAATMQQHLFSFSGDSFDINIPGPDDLELRGDWLGREFTIQRGEQVVATASRKLLKLDTDYAVQVAEGEDALLILCCLLALMSAQDNESAAIAASTAHG